MDNKETAEVLREAAAVIERDGWCQNTIMDDAGSVCLMGAIVKATGGTTHAGMLVVENEEDFNSVMVVVRNTLKTLHPGHINVPRFNDSPHRTEEDVKKFLLSAADSIDVA